jgi:hypothetical protein
MPSIKLSQTLVMIFLKLLLAFFMAKQKLDRQYDILRGINRGAHHDVIDLTDRVFIYAGREFWAWLNDDIEDTKTGF